MITLVLGGNKSGKSDFALDLVAKGSTPTLFIATGKARDLEFREQIRQHRINRAPDIEVMEISAGLPHALQKAKLNFPSVIVDSLDYWLFSCREADCEMERIQEFYGVLDGWNNTNLILVSSEIGLGPLPAGSEVRAFVRSLGALNRRVGTVADRVYLVAAGLPLTLKQD